MKLLNLTHANLKKPISINVNVLYTWYYSDANKCTHLVSTSGGMIPVMETKEEVDRLMMETSRGKNNE